MLSSSRDTARPPPLVVLLVVAGAPATGRQQPTPPGTPEPGGPSGDRDSVPAGFSATPLLHCPRAPAQKEAGVGCCYAATGLPEGKEAGRQASSSQVFITLS